LLYSKPLIKFSGTYQQQTEERNEFCFFLIRKLLASFETVNYIQWYKLTTNRKAQLLKLVASDWTAGVRYPSVTVFCFSLQRL